MSNENTGGGAFDRKRLADLIQRFQRAPRATAEERMTRDQLLDELQDAVGLSGKMATEADILRRAEKLLASR